MAKLERLQKYQITFYDHFISNEDNEIICDVVGYYLNSDKHYHHFTWWTIKTNDEDMFNNNLEKFSLLKSAIISLEEI